MHLVIMVLLLAQTAATAPAPTTPREWIRLARTHAAKGEKDQAFAALQKALDMGFARGELLNADNDLIPLRSDARWAEVVAAARKNQRPCAASPEYRQFDYWLGEWNVESGGQQIAQSSIQIILNDCVVFENYVTADGTYAGKSFSLWNSATKRWEQQYVDTTGRFTLWTGGLVDGTMVFTNGDTPGTAKRMSYIKEGPDKVRQLIESSTDGGKTWTSGYDGLYIRRK